MPADLDTKVLTKYFGDEEAKKISVYESRGGYKSLRKALSMKPADLVEEVKKSNLRGRGGAGFPTGIKWGFLPKDAERVYLVCNCDESEPGTCKDRELVYWDPHQLIEGCAITCWAIGAKGDNYIYMRGEMMREFAVLNQAIEEARKRGYLGKNILGSGFDCDITVHRGAGAYICGEETALLNSLEGWRGQPRLKPPFPAIKGVFGQPTIVNNVETLCNVPHITEHGGQWFADLGVGRSGGTHMICVSGHVENPGVHEVPLTITFNEIIDLCGGIWKGRKVKAVIPGGSSMPPLAADELDVACEFDALMTDERIRPVEVLAGQKFDMGGGKELRTMAGSGAIIVMDDHTDIPTALWRMVQFYHHESCGQCTPCREGTGWMERILTRLKDGRGKPGDVDLLATVADAIAGKTICPLGEAAAWPVLGFLTKFRDEFEAKIPASSGGAA